MFKGVIKINKNKELLEKKKKKKNVVKNNK
jgi:hypothetical protein